MLLKPHTHLKKVPKYSRWHIDEATLAVLKSLLEQTDMPDAEQLSSLACLFNVSVRRVKVWFQNQRQRGRGTKPWHETFNLMPYYDATADATVDDTHGTTHGTTHRNPDCRSIAVPICFPHPYKRSYTSAFVTLAENMLRDESD